MLPNKLVLCRLGAWAVSSSHYPSTACTGPVAAVHKHLQCASLQKELDSIQQQLQRVDRLLHIADPEGWYKPKEGAGTAAAAAATAAKAAAKAALEEERQRRAAAVAAQRAQQAAQVRAYGLARMVQAPRHGASVCCQPVKGAEMNGETVVL